MFLALGDLGLLGETVKLDYFCLIYSGDLKHSVKELILS